MTGPTPYRWVLLIASIASGVGWPVIAEEPQADMDVTFLCVATSELREVAEQLAEISRLLSLGQQLAIRGGSLSFSGGALFSPDGWNVQVNHNGLVVADRGVQDIRADREYTPGQPRGETARLILDGVEAREDIDFTWEELRFDEGSGSLKLNQFSSAERGATEYEFSCVEVG